jgi:type IV secretory pathway VirB2 component (pilin)
MVNFPRLHIAISRTSFQRTYWMRPAVTFAALIVLVPTLAFGQAGGTPFDTGFTAIQTLFTGTIAKVASLVAIVIGGYTFAHGESCAKKLTTRHLPLATDHCLRQLRACSIRVASFRTMKLRMNRLSYPQDRIQSSRLPSLQGWELLQR